MQHWCAIGQRRHSGAMPTGPAFGRPMTGSASNDDVQLQSKNLEIPRCAIAHLRSGPSDDADPVNKHNSLNPFSNVSNTVPKIEALPPFLKPDTPP
jgi:hypothetical protein